MSVLVKRRFILGEDMMVKEFFFSNSVVSLCYNSAN